MDAAAVAGADANALRAVMGGAAAKADDEVTATLAQQVKTLVHLQRQQQQRRRMTRP
jgi:hypothetical protein